MAETVVIRMPGAAGEETVWVNTDSSGSCTSAVKRGSLGDAADAAAGNRIALLLSPSQILRLFSNIPLKGKAKIMQALPFALEEQLAQDVDDLHFAIGERNAEGGIPVAVVARDAFEDTLEEARSAGLAPDAVMSLADSIPLFPSTTTAWIDGDTATIRTADETFSIDADELTTILDMRFPLDVDATSDDTADGEPAPAKHIKVYCDAPAHDRFADMFESLRLRVESLDVLLIEDHGIAQLANSLADTGRKQGVNLLQAAYAVKKQLFTLSPAWKLAGALAVVFAVLTLIGDSLSLMQLNRQEQALDAAAAETLSKAFPGTGEVADPWGQLQSRMRAAGSTANASGPGFIEALNVLANAVDKTKGIEFEALSFRNNVIDLRLSAPAVDVLDTLAREVNNSGLFSAEIQSANPQDGAIRGRIQVKVAGT